MNKIFKVIYSKVRHCYVVVSEIARNQGKAHSDHLNIPGGGIQLNPGSGTGTVPGCSGSGPGGFCGSGKWRFGGV
ncbi:ESPR domain-containing protein [Acidaminococcus sp.]|uniref:ESPR domain-containing protein n=1 Tax=Acidaminococcus sp. TaxID=1872103 RepID=UPI003D7C9481